VLDKQKADKENVLPQIMSNIIQRLTRTNRVLVKNPKGKWSNESLEAALGAIERSITSL
jgi:hypothetical protein